MDDIMNNLLLISMEYGGLTTVDLMTKISILNSIYYKTKRNCTKLKYRKNLTTESKIQLRELTEVHLLSITTICKSSFIPILREIWTNNLFNNYEECYSDYLKFFNDTIEYVNNIEEESRRDVSETLKMVYESCFEYLPDTYKGYNLCDETIRISENEMIKFLKKYKIFLTVEIEDDHKYYDIDYSKSKKYKKI